MKNSILFLLLCLAAGNIFSQTAEQEAIKKVCIAETQAYIDYNFEAWASYHVQSADEQLAWNNPDGSFGAQSGWETIGKGMKDWFLSSQKSVDIRTSDHFTIVVHGDMAFASYESVSKNAEGKTTKIHEYRTLLFLGGQWKILAVQAFIDYPSGK